MPVSHNVLQINIKMKQQLQRYQRLRAGLGCNFALMGQKLHLFHNANAEKHEETGEHVEKIVAWKGLFESWRQRHKVKEVRER